MSWFLRCWCSLLPSPTWPNIPDSYTILFFFLQLWTLFSPSDISTTECYFCFAPAAPFFLELLVIALCSFPVAYWTPSHLGGGVHLLMSYIFYLLIVLMGFCGKSNWTGLPFPSPVDHILSELFIMTCPSWVALHNMANSFTKLCKPLHKAVFHEGVVP